MLALHSKATHLVVIENNLISLENKFNPNFFCFLYSYHIATSEKKIHCIKFET